jgi:hypothetical protein
MATVFITKSNFSKLTHKINNSQKSKIDAYKVESEYNLELQSKLSIPEIDFLESRKIILEMINDNIDLISSDIENLKIKPNNINKNLRVVYINSGRPAFHTDINCETLNKNYINFKIPEKIPDNEVSNYRDFFINTHKEYYTNDKSNSIDDELFYLKISSKFTKYTLLTSDVRASMEQHDNSGVEMFNDIEHDPKLYLSMIKNHIKMMDEYRISSPDIEILIKNYGYGTHKAIDKKNNLKFIMQKDDNPVKEWHKMKLKLKNLLFDYLILEINPKLEFEQSFLETVGFVKCQHCTIKSNKNYIFSLTPDKP